MKSQQIQHQPPQKVEMVELIKVEFLKGDGTANDPVRYINRYYNLDGQLLFEIDDYDVNSDASSIANS